MTMHPYLTKAGKVTAKRQRQIFDEKLPVLKRAQYACGCGRAVTGPVGQEPRPPMQCPDHGDEWTVLDMADPETRVAL